MNDALIPIIVSERPSGPELPCLALLRAHVTATANLFPGKLIPLNAISLGTPASSLFRAMPVDSLRGLLVRKPACPHRTTRIDFHLSNV
ncbi:MAG: hypothetical protein WD151_11900 [Phycisphaeraceae bacterium]